MPEHKHLKIIQALHAHGTLTEAANTLCLSQSALSHQIRYLENKLQIKLWEKDGRKLRLTQAGTLLLQLAKHVLPVIQQAERTLKAYSQGRQGVLRIGVECYPCTQWLTRIIGDFLPQMPDVDIDIVNKFQFSGLNGLINHQIDILVTPDLIQKDAIHYEVITEYELVVVTAKDHPLSAALSISPEDLIRETLFIFPMPLERLDIMTQFLNPAGIEPAKIKEIESFELMLQMVNLERGICVLPEWLVQEYAETMDLHALRIGKQGIQKKLYLALRKDDREIQYIKRFIEIGKKTEHPPQK